jgi:hypothetical protein
MKIIHEHISLSIIRVTLIVLFTLTSLSFSIECASAYDFTLEPTLSADGSMLYHGAPTLVLRADESTQANSEPAQTDDSGELSKASQDAANFTIVFMAPGSLDQWGRTCITASEDEKSAIKKGAAIWASRLDLIVPVTLQVCMSDFGSNELLGVSGGGTLVRDFSGALLTNTWYASSLANNLHGSDLDPETFDIAITLNTQVNWYLGVDGSPTATAYDMPSVVAKQIAHGLNFLGSAQFTGSEYLYGMDGSPDVYDTFMEAADGSKLTSLGSPSAELETLLTSGDLWFNGTAANAANGSNRVRIYAPAAWEEGSSYSHLDDATFTGTPENLMVSVLPAGVARHEPGPVTLGMLRDLGWTMQPALELTVPLAPKGMITDTTPTYRWAKLPAATKYQFRVFKGTSTTALYSLTLTSAECGTSFCTNTPATALALSKYTWQVRAFVNGAWKAWSAKRPFVLESPPKAFTSSFDKEDPGWSAIAGKWKVANGFYRGESIPGKFITARHSSLYGIYNYTVTMRRDGCKYCSHGIIFNADPYTLGSENQIANGYALYINNYRYYTLGMYVNGAWAPLIPWRNGWGQITSETNEIRITYHKETGYMQFYFNGHRMGDGLFLTTYRSGVVGVALYDYQNDLLLVDSAIVTLSAPKSSPQMDGILSDSEILLNPFEQPGSDKESPW